MVRYEDGLTSRPMSVSDETRSLILYIMHMVQQPKHRCEIVTTEDIV